MYFIYWLLYLHFYTLPFSIWQVFLDGIDLVLDWYLPWPWPCDTCTFDCALFTHHSCTLLLLTLDFSLVCTKLTLNCAAMNWCYISPRTSAVCIKNSDLVSLLVPFASVTRECALLILFLFLRAWNSVWVYWILSSYSVLTFCMTLTFLLLLKWYVLYDLGILL